MPIFLYVHDGRVVKDAVLSGLSCDDADTTGVLKRQMVYLGDNLSIHGRYFPE